MLRSKTVDGVDLYSPSCNESMARELSKNKELVCPNCHNRVLYKKGDKVSAHFAHKPQTECVVNNYERETEAHLKGKQVLYSWLTEKEPTASVVMEVFIPETKQIADVLVTYPEGDEHWPGVRWAFEFQHSPLSDAEWRERHNLYRSAGIHAFWIFDADRFLNYSNAIGMGRARLFRDPVKATFQEAGFCYYLDLSTSELTIDCNFEIETKHVQIKGRTVKNEYTLHDPAFHSAHLDTIDRMFSKSYNFGALYFQEIEKPVDVRCEEFCQLLWEQMEDARRNAKQERLLSVMQYCTETLDEDYGEKMGAFVVKNKELTEDDLLELDNQSFVEKYDTYIKKIERCLQEYDQIRQRDGLVEKIIVRRSPFFRLSYQGINDLRVKFNDEDSEIFDQTFLDHVLTVTTFTDYLHQRYAEDIERVNYALEKYGDLFEKVMTFRANSRKARMVATLFSVFPSAEPSRFEYAYSFVRCETTDEIDERVQKVMELIADLERDPLA